MKLERLATMTGFMRHGMTLRDFFQETVRCNVPGLPYVDEHDQIIGRISIRDVYKRIAVPDNILRIADAMGDGDQMSNLDMPEMKALEVMATPVENYLLEKIPTVSPSSTVVKALALMEVRLVGSHREDRVEEQHALRRPGHEVPVARRGPG